MWLLGFLLTLTCFMTMKSEQNFNHSTANSWRFVNEEYDFVIVGSGSAGSVVANRLSEISKWKILLLEIGENPTIFTDIPVLAPMFQFTNYNWGYLMEKQANFCLGLTDQQMHWPRGKVLGGSTIINYMMHVRGNKHDYDRWAAGGNPGWAYDEVLPYFLKSEDSSIRIQDPDYHSTGGFLSVQDVPYRSKSAHVFVEAAQEVGYNYVDYNGANQLGVSYIQATTRRGTRCSSEKAFLRPARHRTNLKILTKSRVTKILIDPSTRKAYGVEYISNKKIRIARASKDVILSAGVFNSPQLLMLSGIGTKDHLEELGIPVLQNLPVGQKLYDHILFPGLAFTVNQSIVLQQSEIENPINFIRLIQDGTGLLTSIGGIEAIAFLKTNVSSYPEMYPDTELIFLGGGLQTDKGQFYRRMYRISDEIYNRVWKPIENSFAWTVFPVLLHPKSYGYMKLKSKNPFHWPKFYGNFLTDPENQDLKTLIAGIREVQRIAAAPAFQKYGTRQVQTPIPGCEGYTWDSDSYWECAIRHITVTLYHPLGTCKMGPATDSEAVVDNRLRVYGVKNLRVVDTSIIPDTLSAHTNVPTVMVGEKAADLIKEDWLADYLIDPIHITRNAYYNS